MSFIKNNSIALLALVIAVGFAFFGGSTEYVPVGGTTNFDDLALSSLTVSGATTFTGAQTFTGASTHSALVTFNAGQLKSYTAASSSVTTGTLAESDILNYDTLLYTPGGAAATKTLTLPATSTLTSMIPATGDRQEVCLYNATGTAASTITLAAGTGMDIERVATSTTSGSAGLLVVPANGSACLTFVRQADTDVTVLMQSFLDAD